MVKTHLQNILTKKKKIKALYLNSSKDNIDGYFKFETFDINFNHDYLRYSLEKSKESLSFFENKNESGKEYFEIDFSDKHQKNFAEMHQVLAHESFHLLQSITFPVIFRYIEWNRKVNMHKWYLFNIVIQEGFKFKRYETIINERSILFAGYDDKIITEIEYCLDDLDIGLSALQSESHDLSMINLIESSALTYQLVITKDFKCESIPDLKNDELYNKAFQRFIEESKIEIDSDQELINSRIIFLLISNLIFNCDEDKYEKIIPMFIGLSKIAYKYNDTLNSYWEKDKFASPKFSSEPSYNTRNNVVGHKSLDGANLYYYILLCDLVDEIIIDINNINSYFFEETPAGNLLSDEKTKVIYRYLESNFDDFGSPYFLPLLIANYNFHQRFSVSFNKIKELDFTSPYKNTVMTTHTDTFVVNNLLKIEEILSLDETDTNVGNWFECCKKHGRVNTIETVINCKEEDSFNQYFQVGDNLKLADIIDLES